MRLINSGGFGEEERKQWRVIIFNNLVQAFVVILKAMDEHSVSYDASNAVRSMCRIYLEGAVLTRVSRNTLA